MSAPFLDDDAPTLPSAHAHRCARCGTPFGCVAEHNFTPRQCDRCVDKDLAVMRLLAS